MHVTMENVFLQMLNECSLSVRGGRGRDEMDSECGGSEGLTPAEWTIHLGVPVVPEEYMMNRGWLNGSCSNATSEPS